MRPKEIADIPEKGNLGYLRSRNTARILNNLRLNTAYSRIDLAEQTSLDKKTVLNIVNDLLDKGMIKVTSHEANGAGRPKEILGINGGYGFYSGIDLGGTHLTGVIVDFAGKLIASNNIEVNSGMEPNTLMKLCVYFMGNLLKNSSIKECDISGIGISFPGFITSSQGYVTSENFPQWHNIPIQEMFQKQYHLPVTVDDSSRLMALAELWYGKGRSCRDFIVADLGFGIGCGIVIDRKIFRGSNGKSGEVGHTLVDINGPACTCGSHGCIESFAAGWALSRDAQTVIEEHPDSLLFETSGNSPEAVNFRQVVLAANLGDSYSINMLKRAGEYIGIGLSNTISFFNPSHLIIGGRLIEDNNIMLEAITETINAKCMKQILNDVEITVSDLGGGASAIGAGISCILNAENAYFATIQNKRF